MKPEDHLDVERLGGLAGMGLPGSRIRSHGRLSGRQLAVADRQQLASLFGGAAPAQAQAAPGAADGFHYRLSLHKPGTAEPAVIEVPESALPDAVRDCVSDELI
jgi:hypothetical protein